MNDALALHHADVGISVDSATDVAKDAADIILLERDLDVLADGVAEGRRIFANTIKYVLMGTSSNFGNMFSVTVAAAFLPFLPMLPFQILLNNLLYDTSQMTIPTDRVDEEQLVRPSHWDIGFIRRFMVRFGPISSVFDFATFAVMLWVFDAAAAAVPLRVVRRVARHPDPHRVRDPHPASPVPAEPAIAAAARLGVRRRDHRRRHPPEPSQRHARVRAPPTGVLRRARRLRHRVPGVRRGREVLLLQGPRTHRRPNRSGAVTPTASTASPPASATTNHSRSHPSERDFRAQCPRCPTPDGMRRNSRSPSNPSTIWWDISKRVAMSSARPIPPTGGPAWFGSPPRDASSKRPSMPRARHAEQRIADMLGPRPFAQLRHPLDRLSSLVVQPDEAATA